MCTPQVLKNMRMMISLRFTLLLKNHHGIHQLMNIQKNVTQMLDHQGQISIPVTAAWGPVFVSTVASYSLAYHATDVMDNDILATALESQIHISIALIGMVKKPLIDPIVLAKQWSITPDKSQKTIQATTQRGIRTMLHPLLLRRFKTNDCNLCYCQLVHPVFSETMFASTVSTRSNRCAQVFATDFG